MAYSRVVAIGNGSTKQFAVNFALDFLLETDVTCRVGNEVDGSGQPLYRTVTFLSTNLIQISGAAPADGVKVVFTRTVDKTSLRVDYHDGDQIDDENLTISQKQLIMAVHEALDGRIGPLTQDIDAGGNTITNLKDPVADSDAVTKGWSNASSESVLARATAAMAAAESNANDSYINAVNAQAAADTAVAATAGKADKSTKINTAGLATGGGDLSADRTITVPKATNADALAGTDDSKAMTPLRVKEAISQFSSLPLSIASGSDFNSILTRGNYYDGNANCLHTPIDGTYWYLEVEVYAPVPGYVRQIATTITLAVPRRFMRERLNASGWTVWREFSFATDASALNYTAPGTGAVVRTVGARLGSELYGSDFGMAVGSGIDNAPAFNKLTAAARATQAPVKIEPGVYYFKSKPNDIDFALNMSGSVANNTVFLRDYTEAGFYTGLLNCVSGCGGMRLSNLYIESTAGTSGGSMIQILATNDTVPIGGIQLENIYISSLDPTMSQNCGIMVDGRVRATEPAGIRSMDWRNVHIFGAKGYSLQMFSLRGFSWNGGGLYAGGTNDSSGGMLISGSSVNKTQYVQVNINSCYGFHLTNCMDMQIVCPSIGMIPPTGGYSVANDATCARTCVYGYPAGIVSGAWVGSGIVRPGAGWATSA